jgi:anti-sigma regulatory factor (Ser/Thr protein kinase)
VSGSLHLSIENDAGGLDRATTRIAEFILDAGLPEDMAHDLRLAAEEMLTNICKYAYSDSGEHAILLDLAVEGSQARLRLSDDGMEFDPLEAPAPDFSIPLEDRPIGGLGIHIVRNLAHSIEYHRIAGRNVIEMTFKPVRDPKKE